MFDDGDTPELTGTEEVFSMAVAPDAYYKRVAFGLRTSPDRPRDKRQVTIRYDGMGEAEIFTMTTGNAELSNILLKGRAPHSRCGWRLPQNKLSRFMLRCSKLS